MQADEQPDSLRSPNGVAAVLVLVLLLDLLLPLVASPSGPPTLLGVLFIGFFVAQVGLHAALVVLVRGRLLTRFASVPLLAVLAIWYTHGHEPVGEGALLVQLYGWMWIFVALSMVVPILAGFRLQRFSSDALEISAKLTRAQFSLRDVTIVVTVLCVLCAVGARVYSGAGQMNIDVVALLFAGLFALTPILLVPSVLIPRRSWLPAVLAVVISYGLQVGVMTQMFDPRWPRELLFVVPAGLQLTALAGLRRLGYRLWRLEVDSGLRGKVWTASPVAPRMETPCDGG